jgi:UDP-2-acetamido-3-amino-2,3-dideoxy-glucuronate N-acetyltransferase
MSIGVLGCGHWGRNHVRTLDQLGVLTAVADATPNGQKLAKELSPDAFICARLDELLSQKLEGIVLATPAHLHFEQAKRCLEAGLDVLVEKPITLNVQEARQLEQLAESSGRILMVGHLLAYHPAFQALQDYIAHNHLGVPRIISSHRQSLGLVRSEENVFWSFAPHDIDMTLRLVGRPPARLLATGSRVLQANIEDRCECRLDFGPDCQASILTNWLSPVKEQRLVLVYPDRLLQFDGVTGKAWVQEFDWTAGSPLQKHEPHELLQPNADQPLAAQAKAFLSAIETRVDPPTSASNTRWVLPTLTAATRSLRSGQWEKIPDL